MDDDTLVFRSRLNLLIAALSKPNSRMAYVVTTESEYIRTMHCITAVLVKFSPRLLKKQDNTNRRILLGNDTSIDFLVLGDRIFTGKRWDDIRFDHSALEAGLDTNRREWYNEVLSREVRHGV